MGELITLNELRNAEDFESHFEERVTELIIWGSDAGGQKMSFVNNKYHVPFIRFYIALNVETGEVSERSSILMWRVKRKKWPGRKYGYKFKGGKLYRVLVRQGIHNETEGESGEKNADAYYLLVKVLEENVQDNRLSQYRDSRTNPLYGKKKPSPVCIDNEFGHFTLEQNFYACSFEGTIDYLGDACPVILDIELGKSAEDIPFGKLKEIVSDLSYWDGKVRKYVAADMTADANDWRKQEEEPITEEQFAKRIGISVISLSTDGSMKVCLYDDNMFGGHSIVVEIDETGQMTEAYLEG